MDITSIQLTNFLSHRNTNISLSGGLVGVFGPNGAGKSSLVSDSITWGLWGKARVSGAGDAMISTGQAFCEVAVTFRVSGNLWKVTRARVRDSKTVLELHAWKLDRWEDLSGPTIKDTQTAIVNLLGMSYEIFKNSSCIEQGQANSFSNLTPAEAANVILDILQLNKYRQYRKLASEKSSNLAASIGHFQTDISSLETQLETYRNSNQLYQDKVQSRKIAQVQYEATVEALTKAEAQNVTILEQLSQLSSFRTSQDAVFATIAAQITKIEDQLRVLGNDTGAHCPLCKTELIEDFLLELQETLKASIATLKEEQQTLHFSLVDNATKMATLEGELRLLKLDSKRTDTKELEKQTTMLDAEIKAFGAVAANSSTLEMDLAKLQAQLEKAQKNLAVYVCLQEAFGPKGIPLLVVDNVVKELAVAINNNLKLLADLPLSIDIITQHEGRQGEMVDTFEIVLNDGLETKPYVNYSGGEKLLIDLAIRLGLSELLAKRNNFKVETLIIDEGLGSLDELNQVNFFNTLANLEAKFKHILVITHTQVKDCFKQRIELKKENGITGVDKQVQFRV
jgi:DNA repair exonuclease SbcCD ATPase subunit